MHSRDLTLFIRVSRRGSNVESLVEASAAEAEAISAALAAAKARQTLELGEKSASDNENGTDPSVSKEQSSPALPSVTKPLQSVENLSPQTGVRLHCKAVCSASSLHDVHCSVWFYFSHDLYAIEFYCNHASIFSAS